MLPKSRGPPLPSSEAFSTGPTPVRSTPLPPPPPCHSVTNVQNTQERGSSSVPKTSGVSLNIVGRLGQYRIEASTADQLAPIMGQIFDAERQAEMQQNMWNVQQMMMTMNPALMNSPTMSGATNGHFWSGTLRFSCGNFVYGRTPNFWSGTLCCSCGNFVYGRAPNFWPGAQSTSSKNYAGKTVSGQAVRDLQFSATIDIANLCRGSVGFCRTTA